MLINILTAATLAAAINIPPSALLATEPKNHVKLASNSCTFTLWHRQQSSIDYVQLNTIFDRANNLRVDVAAHRPATGFNNYVRLDDAHVFAVTGLLDDRNLTISHVPQDGLRFEIGEVWWSTQRSGEEAGCNAWEWEGVLDRRERKLMCMFLCEKVAVGDRGDKYGDAGEGERQVKIGL